MSRTGYKAKGWIVFGAWLNWMKERNADWSKKLTAREITERFNNCSARHEAKLEMITTPQVIYALKAVGIEYKR